MKPIVIRPDAIDPQRLPSRSPGAIQQTVNPAATTLLSVPNPHPPETHLTTVTPAEIASSSYQILPNCSTSAPKPSVKRKRSSDRIIYFPDPPLSHDSHVAGNVEEETRSPSKRARRGAGKAGVLVDKSLDGLSDLQRQSVQRRTERIFRPPPPAAVSLAAGLDADSVIHVNRSRRKLRSIGTPGDHVGESTGATGRCLTTNGGPIPRSHPTTGVPKSRLRTTAETLDLNAVSDSTSMHGRSLRSSSHSNARRVTEHAGTSRGTGLRQSPVAVSSLEGSELSSGLRRSARIKSKNDKVATSIPINTQQSSRILRSANTRNANAPTRGHLHNSSRETKVSKGAPKRKKK